MSKTPPDPTYTFKGSMTMIHCFFLELDKEWLYVGTNDGFVHVWDLKINRLKTQFQVGRDACIAIQRTPDGGFVTQIKCDSLKFWSGDDLNWTLNREIPLEHMGFCKIHVVDNLLICPGRNEGEIKWIDLGTSRENRINNRLKVKGGNLMFLKYLRSAELIIAGFEQALGVYNKVGDLMSEFPVSGDTVMSFDFNELVNFGLLGTSGDTVVKVELVNGRTLVEVDRRTITNPGVSSVVIRNDGKLSAIGCWDGRVRYLTMKNLKIVAVLDSHNKTPVQVVMFCTRPLSEMKEDSLLTGGGDGRINLWDLYCKNEL